MDAVPIGLVLRSRVTTTPEVLSINAVVLDVEVEGVPEIFNSPVVSTVSVESFNAVLLPAPSSTTCSEDDTSDDSSFNRRL